MHSRIEIRMLGRFFVRKANGDVVRDDEWSTGKTTDLLRILALNAGHNVSVSGILDKLWPDVDDQKAHASLRTAASRIRRVLGADCIDRNLGGLILNNVWVDVVAFQGLANEAKSAVHAHDHSRVVSLVREAEALYVSDFRAHDSRSSWAAETRESLRMSRQVLLANAGESAVQLLWMRDAIDFATLAIGTDRCFERPHRTLMQAHAGLGEIELALRAFEHCRFTLSEDLGADPSPQTRALHLQIISGDISDVSLVPFAGRSAEVTALAESITSSIARNGCDVICLTGVSGSGRMALLQAAAARVPQCHVRHLLDDAQGTSNALRLVSSDRVRKTDIAVWETADSDPEWESDKLTTFLSGLDPDVPRVIAIATSDEVGDLLEATFRDHPIAIHRHTTGALTDADLAALAGHALSGPPTARLLRELQDQSQGLAGKAITILREWIASGWIISTHSGLDLYNDAAAITGLAPVGDTFRTLIEQLQFTDIEFVYLLSRINRAATANAVLEVITSSWPARATSLDEVQAELDQLMDLGILRYTNDGYALRNLAIRDAIDAWLRPSVRARLEREFSAIAGSHLLTDRRRSGRERRRRVEDGGTN